MIARSWLRPYLGESAELGIRGLSYLREKSVTLPVKDTETEWNVIQAGLLRSHQLCRDFYRNSFNSCCQGHRHLMARSGWGHTSTRTSVSELQGPHMEGLGNVTVALIPLSCTSVNLGSPHLYQGPGTKGHHSSKGQTSAEHKMSWAHEMSKHH